MTALINVEGQQIQFILAMEKVLESGHWHAVAAPREADFPLITNVDGKRYELYSDGTFATVDLHEGDSK
jgi:hypothetical protein